MRSKCRRGLVALLALFALSAIASAAALATEGPYFKVSGKAMAEGAKAEIRAAAKGTQIIRFFGTAYMTCTTLKLAKGAALEGVKAKNAGHDSEVIEYSGCTVTGNGQNCNVKEPIVTQPLVSTRGYQQQTRTGRIYTIFSSKDFEFAELKFIGSCVIAEGKVDVKSGRNGIIAEVLNSKGEAVEVGKHEAEGKASQLQFSSAEPNSIWIESEGAMAQRRGGLEFGGAATTISGTAAVELVAGENWGVFTQ